MPDHKDIRLIAQRLADLHQKLREGELSIDKTIKEVGEAVTLYQKCKKHFASSTFEVEILTQGEDGLIPTPFDWKALER